MGKSKKVDSGAEKSEGGKLKKVKSKEVEEVVTKDDDSDQSEEVAPKHSSNGKSAKKSEDDDDDDGEGDAEDVEDPGNGFADIDLDCKDCGEPFVFTGKYYLPDHICNIIEAHWSGF